MGIFGLIRGKANKKKGGGGKKKNKPLWEVENWLFKREFFCNLRGGRGGNFVFY